MNDRFSKEFATMHALLRSRATSVRLLKFFASLAALTTLAALTAVAAQANSDDPSWGAAKPKFNLLIILRPVEGAEGNGFGLVKFRQPVDADKIVYLDVRLRHLAPNHSYYLQRATDSIVNNDCTGANWLTLGQGPVAQAITTDDRGTGHANLFRDLAAIPVGTQFDIHFRLIDALTSAVVLESACYQFTVRQ
jgi:hypothetical protein